MTDPSCNSNHSLTLIADFLSQKAMIWFWEQLMDSSENLYDPAFAWPLIQKQAFQKP